MNNNKNHLYSFIFTGTLLLTVLLFQSHSDAQNNPSFQENIQNTSLTASVQISSPIKPRSAYYKNEILNNNFALETGLQINTPSRKPNTLDPIMASKIAFARDLETGKDLLNFETNKYWPIASITKLLTAVVALEKIGPDKIASISQTAIDTEGIAGNFNLNEKYYIKDLVKIMLTVSSNDATVAIAEFYGQENFINEMNAKASAIGMTQTKFYDCTGLSIQNQSTINELAKLASYIIKERPEIFQYTRVKELAVVELGNNLTHFFTNINLFAGQPDFIGGKTGYIESSEQNLLSVFGYKNHKILIIILGSADRYADTQQVLDWVKNSYEF